MKKREEPLIFRGTTKDFTEAEFYCKCQCGAYNMREPFITRLQYARSQARIPFVILSGSMCKKQAEREEKMFGQAPRNLAAHMSGHAADISADPDRLAERGVSVRGEEIFGLIVPALLKAGFKNIGIYFEDKLIHVDDLNWQKNKPVVFWG